jgi:hypothetical protein
VSFEYSQKRWPRKAAKFRFFGSTMAREPIGLGNLTDSAQGLLINGELALESPVAQKAYGLFPSGNSLPQKIIVQAGTASALSLRRASILAAMLLATSQRLAI